MKPSSSVVVGLGFHLRCSIPNLGMCVSVRLCVCAREFLAVLTTVYSVFASPVVWL